jgi:hypothetical protein
MTLGNFDWFLHTMLFYYTRHVLDKQARKASNLTNNSDDDSDSNSNSDGGDVSSF